MVREAGRVLIGPSLAVVLALGLAPAGFAGTSGKISGRILDKNKRPLAGVNVAVPLARTGAVTDAEGHYSILNVPAGTYSVRFALIGYRPVTVQEVIVSADHTTSLDLNLEEAPLAVEEIVVTAKRPVVDVKLTSTMASLSREDIQKLPVQELQDIVNLQAGVVDGHFRGGRLGEVQFQVDGVTVNNIYDNKSLLRIDRSLLEEVQVVSGTFDAEYGQAMSGVVNAVLRRGTDQFRADGEVLGGQFIYANSPRRRDTFFPSIGSLSSGGQYNLQGSVSGPLPLPKSYFLASARRYVFDDYIQAVRRFTPWMTAAPDTFDGTSIVWKAFHPDGDGHREALGYTREWSGTAKLTNLSIPNLELDYQAIFNVVHGRKNTWAFRLEPDGLSRQRTLSLVHGLDATYTLSKKAFTNFSFRQNYIDYRDMPFDSVFDRRYDAAGRPEGVQFYEGAAAVQGVEFTRFTQKTDAIVLKSTLTSQWRRQQQFKAGVELQWPFLKFGTPGHITYAVVGGVQRIERHFDDPPDFPAVTKYRPYLAAGFVHNETEWNDMLIRSGLRLDYFNPRAGLPSDLANPANAIAGVPRSTFRAASRKISLSPRIGISYPITQDAALFFAYGHFSQLPAIADVFRDADYSILRDLQAGTPSYRVMGNPDIHPEKTVQYQFGYRQALTDWLGLETNVFYKDIRDLLGVEFIDTYNGATYARATNADFGDVLGFTISIDQRAIGLIGTAFDYTWQRVQGNASEPRETATRAAAGQDPRPRLIPLNWDQRHTLNATLTVSRPHDFSAAAIVRVASGQPYTPVIETGSDLETNSGRKPMSVITDLRAEKNLRLKGLEATAFGRIFNLFDSRFFNGFVFPTSGSPYYSRFAITDENQLADPTRFYPPRRIEVGITMRAGS